MDASRSPRTNHGRLDALRRGRGPVQEHVIDEFVAGRLSRRNFLRKGSLVGLSMPVLGGILAACGYLLLSGGLANVPALRSTLMLGLIFGAILAGRRALTMRNVAIAAIDRHSLGTIVYTSGTTALPKGVMLSHGNLLAAVEAACGIIDFQPGEMLLSFLPLAHSLERLAGHFLVYSAGLSVAFAERPDTVAKNLAEARPTLLISVPRMLEVVRARILSQVAKQPARRRSLFATYLACGQARFEQRVPRPRRLAHALRDRPGGATNRER